jgi:hypothetical protein
MDDKYTIERHEAYRASEEQKRLDAMAEREKRANEAAVQRLVESGVERHAALEAVKRTSLNEKTQALAEHEARARAIQRSTSQI